MATLVLSNPTGYMGGSAQTSGPFLGYSGMNYVLRYSFKTPASGYIKELTFANTFRHYTGDAGTVFNVRVKVTESATSHVNAGVSTTDYDATIGLSGTYDLPKTCKISGLWLKPDTTYYVYLFPGTQHFLKFCYDNSGNSLASLSYDAIIATYALSINAGEGSSISVNRTSSPSGNTGALSNGATLYTGDVLQITTSVNAGYEIKQQTVNGSAFSSGATHNVSANVTIVTVTGLLGIVYIDTGSALEKFLIYIDNGSSWDQVIPYVDNGSGWDVCH